jgi:Ser/Thr protein kinase RdoA (MazF antagonist)
MPPLINAIEVEGFGWLRRDGLPGLRAELACYAEFVASDLPGRWPGWLAGAFSGGDLEALQAVVDQERQRPVPRGHLAHGDFDATHIWLDDRGRYAGIIDFGEMRGADRHFDLGHFLLHDRTARPVPLFEDFVAGYAEAAALAGDHRDLIRRSAIVSGLRHLSLWLGPGHNDSPASDRARVRVIQLRNLLAGRPPAASG